MYIIHTKRALPLYLPIAHNELQLLPWTGNWHSSSKIKLSWRRWAKSAMRSLSPLNKTDSSMLCARFYSLVKTQLKMNPHIRIVMHSILPPEWKLACETFWVPALSLGNAALDILKGAKYKNSLISLEEKQTWPCSELAVSWNLVLPVYADVCESLLPPYISNSWPPPPPVNFYKQQIAC